MVLIKFEFDERRYASLLSQQHGYGMPKYRGSPMTGGSFWGRIIGFAKGLFSKAAPHLSAALSKAQPHVKSFASKATDQLIDTAVEKISGKLKAVQEGEGIKGKKRKRKSKKKNRVSKKKKLAPKKRASKKLAPKKRVSKKHKRSKFDLISDKF
jgi:hypothetical protein